VDVEARIAGERREFMEVHISSAGAEQVLFSQAVTCAPPRVLYVAGGNEFPAAAENSEAGASGRGNGGGLPGDSPGLGTGCCPAGFISRRTFFLPRKTQPSKNTSMREVA